ncbi:hypothetical protein KY284_032785 [Solanum tuberosum]|nr:hypothetical protein KY284_032785 [Solanum tuberosum]
MQKVMGSAIVANVIQTERIMKKRREGHLPEEPTSTHLLIGTSETGSDDITAYVAKRRKEVEVERVKLKGSQKSVKKSHVKKERVEKRVTVKSNLDKGPGPSVIKQVADKKMTREAHIAEMENHKVLNGRVFDPDIITKFDEETLGIILGVPTRGIWSIEGCKPSNEFLEQATKRRDIKRAEMPNKFLKGEYHLLFEFINKVMVPRTKKRTMAFAADLFLMEKLDELEEIHLPAIMLEHMHRVMTWKLAKHDIPYGYLLNYVFKHFEVPLGRGVPGTTKQMFTAATCSNVSVLKERPGEVEIEQLKSQLQKVVSKGPGNSGVDEQMVQKLRVENEQLLKTNASLSEEFKALNKQVIQAHEAAMSECPCSYVPLIVFPLRPKCVLFPSFFFILGLKL